jgi:hypothetical protein
MRAGVDPQATKDRVYNSQSAIVFVVLLISLAAVISGCAGITAGRTPPNPNPLTITTSSLRDGQVQQSYQATISVSGGSAPYSWSIIAASLPTGLTLNSATGQISGTPNQSGTFPFTAQAKDSQSTTAMVNLSITISPALAVTTSSLPNGAVSVAYPATSLAASGGTPPYAWSVTTAATTFPSGLTLSSVGQITGTPAAAATYNFTVQVKDSLSITAMVNLSITISPAALAATTSSLPNGAVGVAYPATNLAASGGIPPYAWTLASAASTFPTGLTLGRLGGISGTATTAGTFNFTVQVTDSANSTAMTNLSILIGPAPPLIVTTTALPNGTAGAAYLSTNLQASGGVPPYAWTLTSAASTFPGGLTLSNAGTISGTPGAAATYNFTVQVKDSLNATATASLSILVNPALTSLTVTTTSSQLPAGKVNTAYPPTNLTASGGTPPYAWSLTSVASTFPAGLALSNAGTISGTPTTPGTYNFTVKVTDFVSATASASLSMTINQSVWQPPLNTSWQWQLTTPVDQTVNAQMYDIDMFDNDASVVASLHAQGRKVICYISAGTFENWRPDAASFPAVVKGSAVSGWPGENWLDIRRLDILGPIMQARLDLCQTKGFDGVEPDNIDGYTNGTGFPLTAQDQINYNSFLANEAHARGLSVGLKNDVGQVQALLPYFDWALNEQCFQYSECSTLAPFIAAGKAVFEVEYSLSASQFCPQANALNFNAMQKNLNLDAFRIPCR